MKRINISTTKYPLIFALVDDEDFEWLNQWKWHPSWNGYAMRHMVFKRIKGKQKSKTVFMHRLINNTPKGYDTDHINRDKLDNRRSNLRTVTKSQNQMNTGVWSNNTSGVKGIYFRKDRNKFQARIQLDWKIISLGCYKNLEDAIVARKEAERIYHAI